MGKLIDLTGQVFVGLTVIKRGENNERGCPRWLCRCVCGTEKLVLGASLRKGDTKSCGCLKSKLLSDSLIVDITGQRFGRLVAIKPTNKRSGFSVVWECMCDCGKTCYINGSSLRRGHTESCGCLFLDKITKPAGMANFNHTLDGMKRSARNRGYPWKLSRKEVKELITQPCHYCLAEPSNGSSDTHKQRNGLFLFNGLDRVDNDRGYCIDNVVPCCRTCNLMKRAMTQAEFMESIHAITQGQVYQQWLEQSTQ